MTGGLSTVLNNALAGLNVSQQSLAVLSQNIANVNTPGYSRQVISQSAVYLDGQGAGVSIAEITRKVDEYLARSVQGQMSVAGMAELINDYNTRVQIMMGQPGAQNSIDSYVNNFFNALQSLAQTPQDSTLQRTTVNAGVALASQAQQLATSLRDLQFQADQDISNAIGIINNSLDNIAALNVTISNALAVGRSVSELEDQRDRLVREIASYINISTFSRSNGAINITTANGISLLDDNRYQLSYHAAGSAAAFSSETGLAPILLTQVDANGNAQNTPIELVSGGVSAEIVSSLSSGRMQGLLIMRDRQLPAILAQLDVLAANLRDQINAVHNKGTGFPGANSLTGTRLIGAQDFSLWSGSVRIALLDGNGEPISSNYGHEADGMPPLVIDMGSLNTGIGAGSPTVQGIIDVINQYYGVPQNKVTLGNLSDIQIVSNSASVPGSPAQFSFDFNLTNLSDLSANFFVTDIQVLDSTSTDITSTTSTIPSVDLAATNTYETANGSTTVTVNTASAHGFTNGDRIYLSTPPGGPYNNIPAAELGGFFTIANVTATSFEITVTTPANSALQIDVAAQTAMPPYSDVAAGEVGRTGGSGLITADLSLNPTSSFYTIVATVAVDDGEGNLSTSQIRYVVNNNQQNFFNSHISASAANGNGVLVLPASTQVLARAMLVDADGNELSKVNGKYTTLENGYLKIVTNNSSYSIAIDSLDSNELGKPGGVPPTPASNRGFSHYFELNNFFGSNQPVGGGDTLAGSALNFRVESRLQTNPSLISLGTLVRSSHSSTNDLPYTFERNVGDNSIIQQLAAISAQTVSFAAAGGLGATTKTFANYSGQIVGEAAATAAAAKVNHTNAQTLLDGFNNQASAISGVNLDTELANTVIYQNAYTASARVITVANTLFDTLLEAV